MRVVGGKYRGKVLKTFQGTEVRPTSDRAKESLFNILAPQIMGATVLDLFAGTGSVGLEALSRGAKEVYFTDVRRESLQIVKANLSSVKESTERVFLMDFKDALARFHREGKTFDIVFLDPPYHTDFGEEALALIHRYGLLGESGIAVFEHDGKEILDVLQHYDRRKYGVAYLDFYREKQ